MMDDDIHQYIGIFIRRKRIFILTFLLLGAFSSYFALTWSTYRSTATIQVERPDIPEGMTTPIGADTSHLVEAIADQQIQQTEQVVTATANLVDIITKFDLYPGMRKNAPMADVAMAMRRKIKLSLVSTELSNPASVSRLQAGQLAAIAFDLSFTYSDPLIAQRVANELVSRFLDEDLKHRQTKSRETLALLDTQIKALEASMAEQEKKIAEFRASHPDSRPESLAMNQQATMNTYINLQAVESQLSTIEKARGDLRAQLASVDPYSRVVADGQVLTTPAIQLKALQAKYATLSAQYGQEHPDVVKLRHQIEALHSEFGSSPDTAQLQAQIRDLRTNLAAATTTYGPNHPDVLALRRQVSAAEDALARVSRTLTPHNLVKKDADNPAYLMLVSQIEAADSQYASLQKQRAALRAEYERYQRNVVETPANEQTMAALTRDYDNGQLRYRELKQKRLTAEMNEQVDAGRKGARLAVIDPPALPTQTQPPRRLLFLAGLLGSLLGGLAAVIGAETLDRSVRNAHHLADLIGAEPLVAIPYLYTEKEKRQQRWFRIRLAGVGLVALVVGIVLVDRYVTPLDIIWTNIASRFGLE